MQSTEDVTRSLVEAVSEGRLERVSELINTYGLSYSPDWQQGYELLLFAVENGHSEVAKLLLTRGAKVNSENTDWHVTPLHYAALYGDLEIVKMLLNYGVDFEATDNDGKTALHVASLSGHTEIVKVLLEQGAEVDSKTDLGFTPLCIAAQGGHLEVVETLLKFGADARDLSDSTALHEASYYGHKEIVKVLLEHGADVDFKTDDGDTSLHLAAMRDYLEVVESLLKFRATIDIRDAYGRTALHIASEGGHLEVVEALLKYGANINLTTLDNRTPLDLAEDTPAAEPLQRHIIKMYTANLYLCERILQSMKHIMNTFSTFRVQCENEITAMKNEKFKKSNVSFHDVLTKTNLLSAYMRNENIAEALKSEDYRTTFPIYADMLKSNLRKPMERTYLLEQVHLIPHPFDKLPSECVEEIFTYLTNENITAFIVACKPLWSRGELNI